MGFKIRDDAPTALTIPAPIGGGEGGPSLATYATYVPGEPIIHITSDIVERFHAGDPHILQFIEEFGGPTIEVATVEAPPGDPVPPTPPADFVEPPIPVLAPVEPEVVAEEDVVVEPEADATEAEDEPVNENPFAQ